MLGDPRVNQNPGVLAVAILFYRWHNYQAMIVKQKHPEWVDEDIFQAARRKVISTLQVNEQRREWRHASKGKVLVV